MRTSLTAYGTTSLTVTDIGYRNAHCTGDAHPGPSYLDVWVRAPRGIGKNDRIDAEVLRVLEGRAPTGQPLPAAQGKAFEALLIRQRQLVEMLTAGKNRRICR